MNTSSIYKGALTIVQSIVDVTASIDIKLQKKSPTIVILVTTTAVLALSILTKYFQKGWGQTRRDQLGELALRLPYVKKKYMEDFNKQLDHFQQSVRKKWEVFGPLYVEIPDQGWDTNELLKLIERYNKLTLKELKNKHLSGTIYSSSLNGKENENIQLESNKEFLIYNYQYFDDLSKRLQKVFTAAFEKSFLWNSLHSDEFPIGACIDYQVVRMVAGMFGGIPSKVTGFVTSGGTESLFLAVRAYRNKGIKTRGHQPGEGVLIASTSVHAAIIKACKAYLVNLVLVDTDESGKINLEQLEEATKNMGIRSLLSLDLLRPIQQVS